MSTVNSDTNCRHLFSTEQGVFGTEIDYSIAYIMRDETRAILEVYIV